jgi:hypothetical protein
MYQKLPMCRMFLPIRMNLPNPTIQTTLPDPHVQK